jgi:hypothetical protein
MYALFSVAEGVTVWNPRQKLAHLMIIGQTWANKG